MIMVNKINKRLKATLFTKITSTIISEHFKSGQIYIRGLCMICIYIYFVCVYILHL